MAFDCLGGGPSVGYPTDPPVPIPGPRGARPLRMKLSELLRPELVLYPFSVEDKWAALRVMSDTAAASGALPAALRAGVEEALVAREKSMTTGMEMGIAIPHAAVDGIDEVVAVLGISPDGVPFEALDGQPARIVVCLIIPRNKKLLHIKTLAEIAKLLGRGEVRDAILNCEGAEGILATVRRMEGGP